MIEILQQDKDKMAADIQKLQDQLQTQLLERQLLSKEVQELHICVAELKVSYPPDAVTLSFVDISTVRIITFLALFLLGINAIIKASIKNGNFLLNLIIGTLSVLFIFEIQNNDRNSRWTRSRIRKDPYHFPGSGSGIRFLGV